ncbi:NAD(P)-binding protein [Ceratobasidium sp. AG-I]|nr:NAD(P)-binding protein [Ceratobasidium sp. AG-I]
MSGSLLFLTGNTVVVIGGSSGIGYAVVDASLLHGASVIISSSSSSKLEAAKKSLSEKHPNGLVKAQQLDVKDPENIRSFLESVGKFDHLVWTAANGPGPDFLTSQPEEQRAIFDTAFWGLTVAAHHIYKLGLINSGGSITNTSGVTTRRPTPGWTLIQAVGGAQEVLARSLAIDLKPIRVNTISPGVVDTEFWTNDIEGSGLRDYVFDAVAQTVPVGRVGKPSELADAYLFAMKCSYLNGQNIVVDGGGLIA